jgi:hypothetical protein
MFQKTEGAVKNTRRGETPQRRDLRPKRTETIFGGIHLSRNGLKQTIVVESTVENIQFGRKFSKNPLHQP